jgi:hypothetical protein
MSILIVYHPIDDDAFLDKINTEFEQSFSPCAIVSREMDCMKESLLAVKCVFSFHSNCVRLLELFPQFAPLIEEINRLIESSGQQLQTNINNPELWTTFGSCHLTLCDFLNAFSVYFHSFQVKPGSVDPIFWSLMGLV